MKARLTGSAARTDSYISLWEGLDGLSFSFCGNKKAEVTKTPAKIYTI